MIPRRRFATPARSTWYVLQSSPEATIAAHRRRVDEGIRRERQRIRAELGRHGPSLRALMNGFARRRGQKRPVVVLSLRDARTGRAPVFPTTDAAGAALGLDGRLIRRAAENGYRHGGHRFRFLEDLASSGLLPTVTLPRDAVV